MDSGISPELGAVLARSRELGFLGPLPVEHQIEHALGFWKVAQACGISPTRRILDLGSGGGIPGLVIQERWNQVPLTLLDGSVRRCEFLEEACDELDVRPRVEVRCGRAEELGHLTDLRASFDLVVSRSFGAPPLVAECSAPFLAPGGHLIVSEPPDEETEQRWPADGNSLVGLGPARLVVEGFRFAVMEQQELCPDRYPRRTGVPAKRPLF